MYAALRRYLQLLVLGLLALGIAQAAAAQDNQTPVVGRIYYNTIAELSGLAAYDLLEYNNLEQRYVHALLTSAEIASLRAQSWKVVPEGNGMDLRTPQRQTFFEQYRSNAEIEAGLESLAEAHPTLTELVVYGVSHCKQIGGCKTPGGEQTAGFNLLAMRVTNETIRGASSVADSEVEPGDKPVFFLVANVHAREITTPELAIRWLELLLDEYGEDADITWIVDRHELWVVPLANPDGHWLVALGSDPGYGNYPLMHRKNFNQDADSDGSADCPVWPSGISSHIGVDLNRNHSFAWLAPDTWSSACSPTYSGPEEGSEIEVAALQDLIRALIPDQRGPGLSDASPRETTGILVTMHSYGELVLRPWAHSTIPAPNEDGLKAIGDKLAAYSGYQSCQPGDCLYLAHGTTDDWAYGELGIPAFTFEVGSPGDGFAPPYRVIDQDQWPRNRGALLYAARLASQPYALIQGPDVRQLKLTRTAHGLSINADLDDRGHGGNAISGAAFSVDIPIWLAGSKPQPLAASDGLFDSTEETATAVLDYADLAPGKHTLYVQARDVAGNVGTVKAAPFHVPSETYFPVWLSP